MAAPAVTRHGPVQKNASQARLWHGADGHTPRLTSMPLRGSRPPDPFEALFYRRLSATISINLSRSMGLGMKSSARVFFPSM
jgi:hypothetical protein